MRGEPWYAAPPAGGTGNFNARYYNRKKDRCQVKHSKYTGVRDIPAFEGAKANQASVPRAALASCPPETQRNGDSPARVVLFVDCL